MDDPKKKKENGIQAVNLKETEKERKSLDGISNKTRNKLVLKMESFGLLEHVRVRGFGFRRLTLYPPRCTIHLDGHTRTKIIAR